MPYTEQYIKELRAERRLFLIINILACLVLAILVYLHIQQSDRIAKQTALIQQQRSQAIYAACRDQNSRNGHTIKLLHRLVSRLPAKERKRVKVSVRDNILLIDALAPRQNCAQLVIKSVRPLNSGG